MMKLLQILALACLAAMACAGYADRFDSTEIWDLMRYHNSIRRQVASEEGVEYMMETAWDKELAKMAQGYAEECERYERTGKKYHDSVGFAPGRKNFTQVYDEWLSQKRFYDYESQKCSVETEKCAQYLNIVEKDAVKMGCGRSFCEEVQEIPNSPVKKYYMTCFYGAPARDLDKSGYMMRPYDKPAKPCMQCSDKKTVVQSGLCVKK